MAQVPGDHTKQVSHVSLFLAQFWASLLEAGTGTVLVLRPGHSFVSLFGSWEPLLWFYLFIFLRRSSLRSHMPDNNTNNSDEPCCHALGTQPCSTCPLVLFCTLCPSSGQPFKTRLYYLHFADETTAVGETTVTFLRLLIHSVTIWGFNLGLTYSVARILSGVYPSSRYWTCRAGNRHNFQASECTR